MIPAAGRPLQLGAFAERLARIDRPVVSKSDWQRLVSVEAEKARQRGLEEFTFASNEEMLKAMGIKGRQLAQEFLPLTQVV